MGCVELRQLLDTYGDESDIVNSLIAAHVRSCSTCRFGIKRLSKALITDDALSCEECLALLPTYYEATHPEYPLVEMPADEMAQVALHLGQCASCHKEYEELVLISEAEERGEE